ncbi:acyl-CoA thioesterase [Alicyclobacillus tolerans]|uniref:Acyl-CoA thioester hydrolase n=2 Tax=Alicyclobacillus tolerans TaxID=90970 RepID=A0A1M6MHM1_9BACL|nr:MULTISPECIES: thioesterase family protein [Alicyclobacillus]MDP9728207.1 acyl-CoA thioester hydrolase [Alicyclobacillus tengchongensis]SHJ82948.1 acyl-CoA thioester hydrolase [Alicyclobacillus montanus]
MNHYRFHHRLRVRWDEVDAQRVVFNAHYLTYLDVAFAEYIRRGVAVHQGEMRNTVIVKTELEFFSSARYDEELAIGVRTVSMGRTSLQVDFEIKRHQDVLVRAHTVYVHMDLETQKPLPIPEEWRTRIQLFENMVKDKE